MKAFKKLLLATAAAAGGGPPSGASAFVSRAQFKWPTTAIGNTVDFTIPGIGTPKAVMLNVVANLGGGFTSTPQTNAGSSIGWATSVADQFCIGAASENSRTTANNGRHQRYTSCLVIPNPNGSTVSAELTFDSFITDGARFEVVVSSGTDHDIDVTFFYGDDIVNASVWASADGGSAGSVAVNVGFEPSVVFAAFAQATGGFVDLDSAHSRFSVGVAANDGTDTNGSISYRGTDTSDPTICMGKTSSIHAAEFLSNGATSNNAITIQNFGATGFDVDYSGTSFANYEYGGLALEFSGNVQYSLFPITLSSTGLYAETTPGFEPAWGMMGFTAANAGIDVADTAGASSFSIVTMDGDYAVTNGFADADNVGLSIARNLYDNEFRVMTHSGGDLLVAGGYALTSSGWSFILDTLTATIHGFGLALGGVTTDVLADDDPARVLLYKYNDTNVSLATDSTPNGNDGTQVSTGLALGVDGTPNHGRSLSGTQARTDTGYFIPTTGDWTIDLFFQPAAVPPASNESIVSQFDNTGTDDGRMDMKFLSDGRVFFQLGGSNCQYASGEITLNTGTWHYLVFGRRGEEIFLRIDDNPELSSTLVSTATMAQDNELTFGRNPTSGEHFEGLVDHFGVYNRALTHAEKNAHQTQFV